MESRVFRLSLSLCLAFFFVTLPSFILYQASCGKWGTLAGFQQERRESGERGSGHEANENGTTCSTTKWAGRHHKRGREGRRRALYIAEEKEGWGMNVFYVVDDDDDVIASFAHRIERSQVRPAWPCGRPYHLIKSHPLPSTLWLKRVTGSPSIGTKKDLAVVRSIVAAPDVLLVPSCHH